MKKSFSEDNRILRILSVILLWALIYLPSIGSLQVDFDEHKRILPAVSMLESGDWAVPELAGQKYFNKPPLINWAIALSFKVFGGKSEFAARLPSALSVLVFCLALMLLRSQFLSDDARFISALIFMSTVSVFMKGRQAEIDAAYTALTGLATLLWLSLYHSGSKWKVWTLPFAILGLGLLLKGPMILLFFYVTLLSVLIGTKSMKDFFSFRHLCGIAIMLALFLAWALTAKHNLTQGSETAQGGVADTKIVSTWVHELLLRFHDNMKIGKWVGNVFSAFAGFAPWALFVPFLWNLNWLSKIPENDRSFFKFVRNGTVIAFCLVCLMPGTRARYSMPALAMGGVCVGWLLSCQDSRPLIEKIWRLILKYLFPIVALTCSVFFFAALILFFLPQGAAKLPGFMKVFKNIRNILMLAGTAAFANFAVFLFYKTCERRENFKPVFLQNVFFTVLLLTAAALFYATSVIPPLASRSIFREIGSAINARVSASTPLYACRVGSEHFLFYIDRPVRHIKKLHELPGDARLCLIEKTLYDENASYPFFTLRQTEILECFKSDKRQFILLKFWRDYECAEK